MSDPSFHGYKGVSVEIRVVTEQAYVAANWNQYRSEFLALAHLLRTNLSEYSLQYEAGLSNNFTQNFSCYGSIEDLKTDEVLQARFKGCAENNSSLQMYLQQQHIAL